MECIYIFNILSAVTCIYKFEISNDFSLNGIPELQKEQIIYQYEIGYS